MQLRHGGAATPIFAFQLLCNQALTVLLKLLAAGLLVAATVCVHAVGLAGLLRARLGWHGPPPNGFWPMTWMLIRATWCLILLHVIEICLWGLFYFYVGSIPDAQTSFYFSGITYTTVGYGDVVLPERWQLVGAIEGLTGILMCGLSTGFFFAVVSRLLNRALKAKDLSE